MTKQEMITAYETLSAADGYIFGFIHSHLLYYVNLDNLPDALLKEDRASSKKGGMRKLRVRASSAMRQAFIDSGLAILLGGEELLESDDRYNRGERFERVITERLTGERWVKDSVPFTQAGDIELNGRQIQIKLDQAELTNEKTLMQFLSER